MTDETINRILDMLEKLGNALIPIAVVTTIFASVITIFVIYLIIKSFKDWM